MPSVRSLILLSVLILVVSIAASSRSLLQAPDSDGMGRDSYGTRGYGFRAVFEVLDELDVPVRRGLAAPTPDPTINTLVLLAPNQPLCEREPAYLTSLLPWIDRGGRLIIAVGFVGRFERELREQQADHSEIENKSLWEVLELPDVSMTFVHTLPEGAWEDEDSIAEEFLEGFADNNAPSRVVPVEHSGTLAEPLRSIEQLALPGDEQVYLDWETTEPAGTLSIPNAEDDDRVIAAAFPRGQGRIVVVANASIFSNRLLAQADNSLLAVWLFSPQGQAVHFDEFYHGLGVRGNPLILLTQPGYGSLALGLLLFVCLASWREAVLLGPPLPDEQQSRRDIGEYIAAMGQFLSAGRSSRPFLVQRFRDGILRELSVELALPPETQNVEIVVAAVSRTNARRAESIKQAFAEVDATLKSRRRWTKFQTLDSMRRLRACL